MEPVKWQQQAVSKLYLVGLLATSAVSGLSSHSPWTMEWPHSRLLAVIAYPICAHSSFLARDCKRSLSALTWCACALSGTWLSCALQGSA